MKGKEATIMNLIIGQQAKIDKAMKRIKELQRELSDLLTSRIEHVAPVKSVVDNHKYCGKILYVSRKAANSARRLINRDLIKQEKPPMKRAYFCDKCEAWHLTTIPHWMPHPENETLL